MSSRWCLFLVFWACFASSGAFICVIMCWRAFWSMMLNCLKPSCPFIGMVVGSSSFDAILRKSHVLSL